MRSLAEDSGYIDNPRRNLSRTTRKFKLQLTLGTLGVWASHNKSSRRALLKRHVCQQKLLLWMHHVCDFIYFPALRPRFCILDGCLELHRPCALPVPCGLSRLLSVSALR
jgi:hypothetical protein